MYNIRSTLAQAACAIILFLRLQTSAANPLGPPAANPGPNLALTVTPEPVCNQPENLGNTNTSSPHILQAFPRECLDTAHHFFNFPTPMVSRIRWRWKRLNPQHMQPEPGYNFLPYTAAPTGCALTIDVLDDPNAEDKFALVEIEAEFRALFRKCVRGRVHGVSAGYVAVGPRKVLKLSIGPTPPMGALGEPRDMASDPNVLEQRSFNDLL